MKIDNSVDWYVDRIFSAKVGRGDNGRVDIDVGDKCGFGDGERVELKFVDEVGSGDGNSVDKFVKGVKVGVSVGVGDSVIRGVDKCVGAGFNISGVILFGIDDKY